MNGYRVRNAEGEDVTDERQWLLGPDMTLYYVTTEDDGPCCSAFVEAEDCWVEIL